MRVVDGQNGLPKVTFANVSVGENFYYQDRLFLKATGRVERDKLMTCGGMMTHFGVDLADGGIIVPDACVWVVPAKAHVEVEAVGRFN